MNKIIIILSIFLLLMAGIVFYELSNAGKMKITGKATIGKQTFDIEVVKDDKAKQIGLTKVSSIKETQGMLFAFDNPQPVTFWMKNMKFPIDIIFISDDTIVSIVENAPIMDPQKDPVYYNSEGPVNYVLEINDGLVKKHGIKKGDKIKLDIQK